jgi:hypothetical protein
MIFRDRVNRQVQNETHLLRTKSVPSPLLPRFKSAPKFCFFCCKYAGVFYDKSTESDVFVPALERTKSEQRAKKERRKSEQSANILRFLRTKRCRKCLKRTCCRCKFIVRERNAHLYRHAYS